MRAPRPPSWPERADPLVVTELLLVVPSPSAHSPIHVMKIIRVEILLLCIKKNLALSEFITPVPDLRPRFLLLLEVRPRLNNSAAILRAGEERNRTSVRQLLLFAPRTLTHTVVHRPAFESRRQTRDSCALNFAPSASHLLQIFGERCFKEFAQQTGAQL